MMLERPGKAFETVPEPGVPTGYTMGLSDQRQHRKDGGGGETGKHKVQATHQRARSLCVRWHGLQTAASRKAGSIDGFESHVCR